MSHGVGRIQVTDLVQVFGVINSSDLELDCNAWALFETGGSGLFFRRVWEQEGRDETVAQARGLTS